MTTSTRRKLKSFPIPNLREASQMVQRFKEQHPSIVVLHKALEKKMQCQPEPQDSAERRRQRVEAITRQCPRVIVTSKWTWEAPIGA